MSNGTSVIYAFEYMLGLVFFGLFYWIFNGILVEFRAVSVQNDVYLFVNYLWAGSVVIYLVFGMFYFFRRIKTWLILMR